MVSIKGIYFATFIISLLASATFAQQAQLVLKGVEENRNIGFSLNKLEVYTEFIGMPVDEDHQIRLKEVHVVDDLGNSLKLLKGYPYPTQYFSSEKEITIGAELPARKAQRISVVGTIQYFTISGKLQSELNVTDLPRQYHKNLLARTPLRAQLVLVDLAGLNALKEKDEEAYLRQVKGFFENAEHYLDRALERYSYFKYDENNPVLHFYKSDPEDEIEEIQTFDRTGAEIATHSFSSPDTHGIELEQVLTPETRLRIIVKNEDAVTEIPFQIKDVDLP